MWTTNYKADQFLDDDRVSTDHDFQTQFINTYDSNNVKVVNVNFSGNVGLEESTRLSDIILKYLNSLI